MLRKKFNGVWTAVSSVKKKVNGAWADCAGITRKNGSNWYTVWRRYTYGWASKNGYDSNYQIAEFDSINLKLVYNGPLTLTLSQSDFSRNEYGYGSSSLVLYTSPMVTLRHGESIYFDYTYTTNDSTDYSVRMGTADTVNNDGSVSVGRGEVYSAVPGSGVIKCTNNRGATYSFNVVISVWLSYRSDDYGAKNATLTINKIYTDCEFFVWNNKTWHN